MVKLHIFLATVLIPHSSGVNRDAEPQCVSSFNYNYQMLQKIVELEQKLNNLDTENRRQKSLLEKLSTEGGSTDGMFKSNLNRNAEPQCVSSFNYNYQMLQKIVELEQKLNNLDTENRRQKSLLEKLSTEGAGSTYVRWGRNTCPEDATLIYNGYTAGKYYNEAGSGSDTLCLPSDPTWSNYSDGNASCCRGRVFASEIHVEEPSGIFPYQVHTQDTPCAVCKTLKSTTLMIPARSNCYPGWKLEYSGYVMANYKDHAGPHNHICVDSHPEFVPNGGEYKLHHILYLMEAQCGSLPCPPYVQGRELACVVCSI